MIDNISIREHISQFIISLPFIAALLLILSPLVYTYGISFKIYAPFYTLVFITIALATNSKIDKFFILFSALVILTGSLVAIFHQNISYMWFSGNIVLGVMLFSVIDKKQFIQIVKISTIIIIFMLIGACITYFDIYANGMTDTFFETKTGRSIPIGSFSLGHITTHGSFRPSSIYDEPGTFSFVIVFIAATRHLLGMSKGYTWLILILGLITASIAHLIYVFFHFLAEVKNAKKLMNIFFIIFSLLVLVASISYIPESLISAFSSRLEITSLDDGLISGNNRLNYLLYSMQKLHSFSIHEWFFGASVVANLGCCNPLLPLTYAGIIGTWPYYLIILFLLLISLIKRDFVVFAIFLVLLQRPDVQSAGTSFLVGALLVILVSSKFEKNKI